jgi:hypothetical protein
MNTTTTLDKKAEKLINLINSQSVNMNEHVDEWHKNREELKAKKQLTDADLSQWRITRSESNFSLEPAMALLLQKINIYEGQRNVSNLRMDTIAEAVLRNQFHGNKLIIAHCGERYTNPISNQSSEFVLTNGGNTTMSSIKYGLTIPHNTLQVVYCPTVRDIQDLYTSIDRKHSTRTVKENNKAFLTGCAYANDWRDENGNFRSGVYHDCVTAICAAVHGPKYRSILAEQEEKIAQAEEHYEVMIWIRDFIYDDKNKAPQYMKRAVGVLGMMAKTAIAWGIDRSAPFWNDIRLGVRVTPNNRMNGAAQSPQQILFNYLQAGKCTGNTEPDIFHKVQYAVNAWAKGNSISRLYTKVYSEDSSIVPFSEFRPNPNHLPTDEETGGGDFCELGF